MITDIAVAVESLADLLKEARRVLVFTGAGISTGSGIPDFRGPQGLWTKYPPVYYDAFLADEAARVRHWRFKLESWPAIRDAVPNAAHRAIAALERAGRVLLVVTQNIDGLHTRAGTSPARLVELHGTNLEVGCLSCGARSDPEPHFRAFAASGRPPRCPCGGLLKPATISFGQPLRAGDLERALAAAKEADLVLALGSTLSVYPAATVPAAAAQRGTPYAIVNQGETDHDGAAWVTLRVEADVTVVLPAAVRAGLGPHALPE